VAAVTSKPEFYSAYTPYQPEASQGTLQAIYEFQTLIAELTAMDVANASMYDGATAVAEAAMMAHIHTGRNEVVVAGYLHPEYLEVLRGFSEGRGIKVRKGTEPNSKTAAVIFQQPDFLGMLVDARGLTESAHRAGALAIACVDPISLALLAPPGEYRADIAAGEGQQLGLSPSYGGPHVGFIACSKELVRRLPGRLIGTSHDAAGRRGFVLTLTAREQHIRRERASSNICTNHSLCALAASVYMTYMGAEGLRQVAEVSFQRAHALAGRLSKLPGWEMAFPDRQFLYEFPIQVPKGPALNRRLARKGILGGLDVHRWFRELKGIQTFSCTEVNDARALDELVKAAAG
jgi:glycine dehydrogenase subunit 1